MLRRWFNKNTLQLTAYEGNVVMTPFHTLIKAFILFWHIFLFLDLFEGITQIIMSYWLILKSSFWKKCFVTLIWSNFLNLLPYYCFWRDNHRSIIMWKNYWLKIYLIPFCRLKLYLRPKSETLPEPALQHLCIYGRVVLSVNTWFPVGSM